MTSGIKGSGQSKAKSRKLADKASRCSRPASPWCGHAASHLGDSESSMASGGVPAKAYGSFERQGRRGRSMTATALLVRASALDGPTPGAMRAGGRAQARQETIPDPAPAPSAKLCGPLP